MVYLDCDRLKNSEIDESFIYQMWDSDEIKNTYSI